jgi:hypothetical protein
MWNIFSPKGSIGRLAFVAHAILFVIAGPLGISLCLIIALIAQPPTTDPSVYIVNASVAAFFWKYLSWVNCRWTPLFVFFGFYLGGQRILLCAYIKRARDIGIEIAGTSLVPFYFLDRRSGAGARELLFSRGRRDKGSQSD